MKISGTKTSLSESVIAQYISEEERDNHIEEMLANGYSIYKKLYLEKRKRWKWVVSYSKHFNK